MRITGYGCSKSSCGRADSKLNETDPNLIQEQRSSGFHLLRRLYVRSQARHDGRIEIVEDGVTSYPSAWPLSMQRRLRPEPVLFGCGETRFDEVRVKYILSPIGSLLPRRSTSRWLVNHVYLYLSQSEFLSKRRSTRALYLVALT